MFIFLICFQNFDNVTAFQHVCLLPATQHYNTNCILQIHFRKRHHT